MIVSLWRKRRRVWYVTNLEFICRASSIILRAAAGHRIRSGDGTSTRGSRVTIPRAVWATTVGDANAHDTSQCLPTVVKHGGCSSMTSLWSPPLFSKRGCLSHGFPNCASCGAGLLLLSTCYLVRGLWCMAANFASPLTSPHHRRLTPVEYTTRLVHSMPLNHM